MYVHNVKSVKIIKINLKLRCLIIYVVLSVRNSETRKDNNNIARLPYVNSYILKITS